MWFRLNGTHGIVISFFCHSSSAMTHHKAPHFLLKLIDANVDLFISRLSRITANFFNLGRPLMNGLPASVLALWILTFILLPLAIMAVYSFWTYRDFETYPTWTLGNYTHFFRTWVYVRIMLQTVAIAGMTTIISIILAYPVAYYLARKVGVWREFLVFMIMIPFCTSGLIRTYTWMTILGEQGVVNSVLGMLGLIKEPLRILYTFSAVMIGAIYLSVPFAVLTIFSSLEKLGSSLQDAASDLGASPWQAFRRVTLPLSMAGVQSSTIFVFIPTLGLFVTPTLLGGSKGVMIANLQVNTFKNA